MAAALTIAAKDLRQRLRDRSAIVLGVIAPVVISVVMSFAFRGTERFHADIALVDLDRGTVATAFRELLARPELQAVITTKTFADEASARKAVADRQVAAAWILPAGLTTAATTSGQAEITTLTELSSTVAGDVASSIAASFASRVNAQHLAVATAMTVSGGRLDVSALLTTLEQMPATERVLAEPTGSRPLRAINYYGPGMAVFFGFFTIGFTARSWFADRREGMLDRVAAAPVAPFAVALGKALSAFVFTLCSLAVIGIVTTVVLDADWGPPIAALAVCAAVALAVTSLAAFLVTVARSERQADGLASILVFGLALLGGNFMFLSVAPSFVRTASLLTPNGWALRAFMDLSTGAGSGAATKPILAISAFSVVVGSISAVLARHRSLT